MAKKVNSIKQFAWYLSCGVIVVPIYFKSSTAQVAAD